MGPRSVQSIVDWATPTSCCEVRRFRGLTNYRRRIVESYVPFINTAPAGWRSAGCLSDFYLRVDNQAIALLKTNTNLNRMYLRRDRGHVAYLQCKREDGGAATCLCV